MSEGETGRVYEFKPHWLTMVGPWLLALVGVAVFKFGRDFLASREGVQLANEFLRAVAPVLGPNGVKTLENVAAPAGVVLLFLIFGLPLAWAWIRRSTTILAVDGRQIIWRRGVIARDITQVEIGEIVGVNVSQSLFGRLFGYGTVDVETRGEDRLVMELVGNARGFAGLVLDFKRRLAA